MQSPCDVHRAPRASRARGIGGYGTVAPGTMRGTLGLCRRRGVCDSARSLEWEACARLAPPSPGSQEEMASQRSGAGPAPIGRSGRLSRGHGRVEGADT